MEDYKPDTEKIDYKISFADLKPRICVYGVYKNKIFSRQAIVIPHIEIGFFSEIDPKQEIDIDKLKKEIKTDRQVMPYYYVERLEVRNMNSSKNLEGKLCEAMKRAEIHVVVVDKPGEIEPIIKKHARNFCAKYEQFEGRMYAAFQRFIAENPSLSPLE